MSRQRASGDHFSSVSAGYAAFRPTYPLALFELVASLPSRRDRAWDCGAGSGQATMGLAEHFRFTVGTDVSPSQLAQAPHRSTVAWIAAAAESVPLADGSIDLVTVAQALHWFDHARFYAEVRRVATHGAAFAAWLYAAPRMEAELGAVLRRYQSETVGPYWPPERRLVDDHYRSIPFPFEAIPAPTFQIEQAWTLPQLAGYLRTWSATTRYVAANGRDPVLDVERALEPLWGEAGERRPIYWPLTVLAGRI